MLDFAILRNVNSVELKHSPPNGLFISFFYVFPLTFLLWDECLRKVVSYEMIVNKLNLLTYDDYLYNVTIINN